MCAGSIWPGPPQRVCSPSFVGRGMHAANTANDIMASIGATSRAKQVCQAAPVQCEMAMLPWSMLFATFLPAMYHGLCQREASATCGLQMSGGAACVAVSSARGRTEQQVHCHSSFGQVAVQLPRNASPSHLRGKRPMTLSAISIWSRSWLFFLDESLGDSNADGDEAEAMHSETDSRGGGFGGDVLPESSVDLAEAILAENPLHPTFEVALDAAAQSGASQIPGDGDEECHGADIATQNDSGSNSGSSSSGSSSSSSTSSSSGSSRASAMSNDAGEAEPEAAPRAGNRGAALGPSNVWIDLACKFCGDASFAQIKDFSGFGRSAMYICPVKLADGSYPTKGCLHKRRQWSMHRSKQECKKLRLRWLERHRQCCD